MSKQQEALAATLGMDIAELRDCRYQETRTWMPVYSGGENYYCTSQTNPGNLLGLRWGKMKDQFFAERANTVCWVAHMESAAPEKSA